MNTNTPYIPPTLRGTPTIQRFIGAIQTRISQRQKALWSRVIGAGFIAEDIEFVWPDNDRVDGWFGIRYSGRTTEHRLADLNLRELDELLKWMLATYGEQQEQTYQPPT